MNDKNRCNALGVVVLLLFFIRGGVLGGEGQSVHPDPRLVDDGIRSVIVDIDADGSIDEEYTQWYDESGFMFKEGQNLDGVEGFELISSFEYGNRGLQKLQRVQSLVGSEEYIDIEETSLHHYTMSHDINSSFWEQSHEKFFTITCENQQVEEE